MDLQSISQAYAAVKAIKELGEALVKGKIDAAAKDKISEMMSRLGHIQDQLFEIREQLISQQEENHKLRSANKDMQDALELKNKVVYKKPSYWVMNGEKQDGPFCQRCWDADKKLVRLQGGDNDYWTCRECKQSYTGPEYKVQPPTRIPRRDPFSAY